MEVPRGEIRAQLGCKSGPKWAQEKQLEPKMARDGLPRIYSMGAARLGGHFGAILDILRFLESLFGVSEGVLGVGCWGSVGRS